MLARESFWKKLANCTAGGRHIEASALVEKAEAMISAVSVNVPQIATASTYRDGGSKTDAAPSEEPLAARIVTNVANGLTKVLVCPFRIWNST
jgi:hypothetical protein